MSRARSVRRFEFTHPWPGGEARVVLYADETSAHDGAAAARARLDELARNVGDGPESELTALTLAARGASRKVSDDLYRVLQYARKLSRRTNGAFDITAAAYGQLWQDSGRHGREPSEEELMNARRRVGWEKVQLEAIGRTARLEVRGMSLDLAGIERGYAADQAMAVLRQRGVPSAMVDVAGVIVAGDPPPGKQGWEIEIGHRPVRSKDRWISLHNAAVASSGAPANSADPLSGALPVIDPRSGEPPAVPVVALVFARGGMTAAGLARAACVLGPHEGEALVRTVRGARVEFTPLLKSPRPEPAQPEADPADPTTGWNEVE